MNIKKILADNLFVAFFSLCTVMLAESAILKLTDNSSPIAVAITSFLFMAITIFVYLNRKKALLYACVAITILLTLWLLNKVNVPVSKFLFNTVSHFFNGATLKTGEKIFISSILSMLMSAVFFSLSRIRTARYIIAASTIILLVYYGICEFPADFIASFSAAGIIFSVPTELCLSLQYKKEAYKKLNGVLSFLFLIFVIFSISVAILPSSDKPISWSFVTNLISGIADRVDSVVTDISFRLHPEKSEFSINMQGYSDSDSTLGSGISGNDQKQLFLSFPAHPRSSVYLIGSVSDIYTGHGWSKSEYRDFSKNDFYLDYCETMLAFERAGYTEDDLTDFTSRSSVTVKYNEISTKTLFYPLKTTSISNSISFNASSPSVFFDKRADKGDEYRLNYLEINYHSKQLTDILRNTFSYGKVPESRQHTIDKNIPSDIEKKLSERAEYIKKIYTALPDSVTPRTYSLAEKITEDCKNDYEKLCSIEAFLKNFTYTKTPGNVPDGNDPVDYFLFENQTGYCTYFASAMTLLARCEGIPARYVQGFTVSEINSLDNNPVPGSDAHAWTEVYFEGTGWIPFEPTSTYSEIRYGFEGKEVSDSYKSKWDEYNNTQIDNIPNITDIDIKNNKSEKSVAVILIVVIVLTVLILFSALYIAIKIRSFLKKYHKGTDTEKFIQCYKMLLYLFEKKRYKRKDGETIDCFASNLSALYPNEKISFSEITSVFDRIRYGDEKASNEELKNSENYLRMMYAEITENKSKFAAIITFTGYCLLSIPRSHQNQ